MHYVNIKIKTKNTVGVANRIVIFLHCSFPLKCLGGRGMGVALLNHSPRTIDLQVLSLPDDCMTVERTVRHDSSKDCR